MSTVQDYASAISRMLGLVDNERIPHISPDTERRHQPRYDLTRIDAFLTRLGGLQKGSPTVHIAGSKGKGSTAAMCANILRCQGYRVGMYSSPHLHTFRERISLNAEPIPEKRFAEVLEALWGPMQEVNTHSDGRVTVFELLTAMGLAYFHEEATDINIIEVGLGGRLDATNVVTPSVSVITSISLDHTQVLGDTIEEVAWEKAGIIKPGVPVVTAPQDPAAMQVIRDTCHQRGAELIQAETDLRWHANNVPFPDTIRVAPAQSIEVRGRKGVYNLQLSLLGRHQFENATTAVGVMEALNEQGHKVSTQAMAEGLATVQWPCRLELLAGCDNGPMIVADGAHNPYSAQRLRDALPDCFHYDKVIVVLGISRDKDLEAIVSALAPVSSQAVVTGTRHPRSAPPDMLADLFRKHGVQAHCTSQTTEAIALALELAGESDLVLATGSLFLAAEVREVIKGIPPEIYPELGRV
jgi:dihydrofolate synthase/folylpolyglutamate synthase